jgi:hypothetical protein
VRHTHVGLKILVLQIESVLPDINSEDRDMSSISREQMVHSCSAEDSHSRRSWVDVVTISSFLAEPGMADTCSVLAPPHVPPVSYYGFPGRIG